MSAMFETRKVLAALFICSCATSASAYIDPGTGVLAWQGLIAIIGALVVFIRNPLESIKRLLNRFRRK